MLSRNYVVITRRKICPNLIGYDIVHLVRWGVTVCGEINVKLQVVYDGSCFYKVVEHFASEMF